jgi:endonuclease/exonuclease/phosphatase family metal-dependent hydrolase
LALWATAAGAAATSRPASRSTSRPTTRPTTRPFTIAAYNINGLNKDLPAVTATIVKADADVVCLQEVNREAARHFRAHLRGRYGYMDFRHASRLSGLGFLSKVPLRNVRHLRARHGFHDAWIVRAELGGRDVQLAAVHLQPTLPRPGDGLEQIAVRLAEMEKTRAREIRDVVAALSRRLPAIILGDLNSTTEMYAPGYLQERGFVDSFASVTDEPDRHPTWHGTFGYFQAAYRIDYIFHSPDFHTTGSRVIRSDGSDHFLLVSSLAWGAKRPTTRPAHALPTTRPAEARPPAAGR